MDLVAGMWQLLSQNFTAVPHELWRGNEAGIGRRGRLTEPVTTLVGTLGCGLVQMKANDPEFKGMVEHANRPHGLLFTVASGPLFDRRQHAAHADAALVLLLCEVMT